MKQGNNTLVFVGLTIAVLMGYGVYRLHFLYSSLDEALPPYSSYRSDPLGTKAFYEALNVLPDTSVVRNRRTLKALSGSPRDVLLILGCQIYGDANQVEKDIIDAFERFSETGGRVVVAFYPYPKNPTSSSVSEARSRENTQDQAESKEKDEDANEGDEACVTPETDRDKSKDSNSSAENKPLSTAGDEDFVNLEKRWGIRCEWGDLRQAADDDRHSEIAILADSGPSDLPETVGWYSGLYFVPSAPEWRTIYTRGGKPVVVERSVGLGSIVLAGDSFFVSNEGLWRERHASLLAWLVGGGNRVIFDEYLKGISEEPGIMMLMRRYRLHGLFVGLLVVGLLWIWQVVSPLVPRFSAEENLQLAERQVGKLEDTLVGLVRRSVPQKDVLRACVEEWSRDFGNGELHDQICSEVEGVASTEQQVVIGYNRIAERLAESRLGQ